MSIKQRIKDHGEEAEYWRGLLNSYDAGSYGELSFVDPAMYHGSRTYAPLKYDAYGELTGVKQQHSSAKERDLLKSLDRYSLGDDPTYSMGKGNFATEADLINAELRSKGGPLRYAEMTGRDNRYLASDEFMMLSGRDKYQMAAGDARDQNASDYLTSFDNKLGYHPDPTLLGGIGSISAYNLYKGKDSLGNYRGMNAEADALMDSFAPPKRIPRNQKASEHAAKKYWNANQSQLDSITNLINKSAVGRYNASVDQFNDKYYVDASDPEAVRAEQLRRLNFKVNYHEKMRDKNVDNYTDRMESKAKTRAVLSIAAALATGGAAAGGAFGSTVAGSTALTGAAAGAAGGAVTGGVKGALTGAALGGIGGYAKDAFTGVGGLEGISDSIGLGDVYDGVSGAVDNVTGAVGDFAGGVADDFTGAVGDVVNSVNPFYEAPTSIGLGNTTFNPLPTADMALAGDYSLIPNSGDVFLDNLVKSTTPYNPLPTADSVGYLSDLDLVTQNPSVFNSDNVAPYDPATLGMGDTQIVAEQMFPVVETSAGRINEVADNLMAGAVNVADYTSAPIPSMVDVMSGAATINNDGMLGNIEPTSASPVYDFASTAPDKTSLEQQFVDDGLKPDAYNPLPTADSFSGMQPESVVNTDALKKGLEMLSGAGEAQPAGGGVASAPFVGATGSGFKDNRLKSQLLTGVNPLLMRRGLLG